jgi:hypothetical protein
MGAAKGGEYVRLRVLEESVRNLHRAIANL